VNSIKLFEDGMWKRYLDCVEGDAETKESTRKTEKKTDGRNKEGHERKKPK